eukprot:16448900-Heterocapsa_arctica.AAC.1
MGPHQPKGESPASHVRTGTSGKAGRKKERGYGRRQCVQPQPTIRRPWRRNGSVRRGRGGCPRRDDPTRRAGKAGHGAGRRWGTALTGGTGGLDQVGSAPGSRTREGNCGQTHRRTTGSGGQGSRKFKGPVGKGQDTECRENASQVTQILVQGAHPSPGSRGGSRGGKE